MKIPRDVSCWKPNVWSLWQSRPWEGEDCKRCRTGQGIRVYDRLKATRGKNVPFCPLSIDAQPLWLPCKTTRPNSQKKSNIRQGWAINNFNHFPTTKFCRVTNCLFYIASIFAYSSFSTLFMCSSHRIPKCRGSGDRGVFKCERLH